MLCDASLADSTKAGYDRHLEDWFSFCEVYGRDPKAASPRSAAEYIWYLYQDDEKAISSGAASRRLTALGHHWTLHGEQWCRKSHPILAKMLKGYRRKRPPELRPKKPWTFVHMQEAWNHLDLNTYSGNLAAATLCIGYFYGGRVSEYAAYARKDWTQIICPDDLELIYNGDSLISIIIDFKYHKSNKDGIYCGKVDAICACDTGICPIHMLQRYLEIRNRTWRDKGSKYPLLITSKGLPIRAAHVNNLLKALAIKIAIDPTLYSSHSMRSGRATDLARALKPSWFIKKWGRWRSECWQDFYAKLDFSDIAKLSKLTLVDLGLSGNSLQF